MSIISFPDSNNTASEYLVGDNIFVGYYTHSERLVKQSHCFELIDLLLTLSVAVHYYV